MDMRRWLLQGKAAEQQLAAELQEAMAEARRHQSLAGPHAHDSHSLRPSQVILMWLMCLTVPRTLPAAAGEML